MHLVTLARMHILYMRYEFNIQREFIQHMMRVIRKVYRWRWMQSYNA